MEMREAQITATAEGPLVTGVDRSAESTWEERMSAKARARIAEQKAAEGAARLKRLMAEAEKMEEKLLVDWLACFADFNAGPPCWDCFSWMEAVWSRLGYPSMGASRFRWTHHPVDTEDGMCWHECHGPEGAHHPVIVLA